MVTATDVGEFLETYAPSRLAEEWDNVGLLVGRGGQAVRRLMTCLTVTPPSVAEAQADQANMIVAHHPLPFRPLTRLTDDTPVGRLLLDLIRAEIAVYSPHTAFDSAAAGINQRLAEGLGLEEIQPLLPAADDAPQLGAGRWGRFSEPLPLTDIAARLKEFLQTGRLQAVGESPRPIARAAVACGAAGQFLDPARRAGCELLVTGETNFHTCLAAQAQDMALLLPGHYASERFAVEQLATVLQAEFPELEVWASRREADPLRWL